MRLCLETNVHFTEWIYPYHRISSACCRLRFACRFRNRLLHTEIIVFVFEWFWYNCVYHYSAWPLIQKCRATLIIPVDSKTRRTSFLCSIALLRSYAHCPICLSRSSALLLPSLGLICIQMNQNSYQSSHSRHLIPFCYGLMMNSKEN